MAHGSGTKHHTLIVWAMMAYVVIKLAFLG